MSEATGALEVPLGRWQKAGRSQGDMETVMIFSMVLGLSNTCPILIRDTQIPTRVAHIPLARSEQETGFLLNTSVACE